MHRLIFVILCFATTLANTSRADDAWDAVRREFRLAYSQTNGNAAADSAALRSYVLYPYLQQARIRRNITGTTNFAQVDRDAVSFLRAFGADNVTRDLRRDWYASLARRQEWRMLLANYRDIGDPTLQCHALTARARLSRLEGLQRDVIAVWSSAPQSRRACEEPFEWLRDQQLLTPMLIEGRARLALTTGNATFARQLLSSLPNEQAEPLQTWAALIDRPRAAIDAAIATPNKPIEADALFDGWTRLARADQNAAMARFRRLAEARAMPPHVASRYAQELALALSWSRRNEALDYFARVRPSELDDRGHEWYARAALWNERWPLAESIIDKMPTSLRTQARWRYWAARVAEHRGQRHRANEQYEQLLGDDNYYAALAAARLGRPYTPQQADFSVDPSRYDALLQIAEFARARELYLLGMRELKSYAYDEWRRGYAQLKPEARVNAIGLASSWGWHEQAILTAADQRLFDDYRALYPRPYDAEVRNAAALTKLPDTFIYSVIRQESLYQSDAQSSAGARGAMQLLPETARLTARRWPAIAQSVPDTKNLFDPATNILIGSAKLRDMLNRFDDTVAVALAAYNAGPGAAQRWLPERKMEADIWIENIPYNETRTYVQRIHWHNVVFDWLATGQPQDTTRWLTRVEPARR